MYQEQAVYKRCSGQRLLLVGVYVDDLMVTGTNVQEISNFKRQMKSRFEMSDLGLLHYYLEIEVKSDRGITLAKWLRNEDPKRSKSWECNSTQFPMKPGLKLSKEDENPKKQGTMTLSSCEAEFMVATSAACQALWLWGLLSEMTGEKGGDRDVEGG
ncbi:uncharacterized protein LOC143554415 [Bidens hawaiensis]|uniref:uncharacterized protein LOC143554415 n=1 Tax=Bidens hawaiensis TaxID=980011 RepID=UPI0040495600